METVQSVHPLDYFSFEEGGKVWWFDIRSMIGCLNASFIPLNPYTRKPLSIDTRHRLRMLYKYRIHNRLSTLHETIQRQSLAEYQWMRVCQILYENGFEDYTPEIFTSIEPRSIYFMFLLTFIRSELYQIALTHTRGSKYYRFAQLLKHEIHTLGMTTPPSVQLATTLMILLNDVEDAFHVCAAIARSVARL
jgi:hypothetical protein